ncbi:hypothetical protein Scep_019167 [Stephania cephalantha]|uniref:Uncharacterized protein n=1 Tax=Stephania cephalantha TaxID=152367 RepID=A0AAP0IAQ1_9MAGN
MTTATMVAAVSRRRCGEMVLRGSDEMDLRGRRRANGCLHRLQLVFIALTVNRSPLFFLHLLHHLTSLVVLTVSPSSLLSLVRRSSLFTISIERRNHELVIGGGVQDETYTRLAALDPRTRMHPETHRRAADKCMFEFQRASLNRSAGSRAS